MLLLLIFLPVVGGLISWVASVFISQRLNCILLSGKRISVTSGNLSFWERCRLQGLHHGATWIAATTMVMTLIILGFYWQQSLLTFYNTNTLWSEELDLEWIPFLGIRFHLLLDGLSILFIVLAAFLALFAIFYSYCKKVVNAGLFCFFILWSVSAVIGLLAAADLFLFFLFWEMVSIPIYFLIILWGRQDLNVQLRFNGAIRLVIFTQLSGLLMLISITSLALVNFTLSGNWTFDSAILINTPISSYVEFLLMIGFLAAFIIRLPLVPFHGWFIDAHIASSTTTSVLISGFLTNTTIYGILRFAIPIFPNASITVAPFVIIIALFSLYYSALLIFNQNDIKKLIIYVHIALISFLMAMVYIGGLLTYQGIIIQSIGISILVTGLFTISGLLTSRYQTYNLNQLTRLGGKINHLSAFTVIFTLTTLGIPGTANFFGNLILLFGSFEQYSFVSILLIIGLLLVSIAMLIRMQPIFHEHPVSKKGNFSKFSTVLSKKDFCLLILLILVLFIVGIYPQFILDTSYPVLEKIQHFWENSQSIVFKERT